MKYEYENAAFAPLTPVNPNDLEDPDAGFISDFDFTCQLLHESRRSAGGMSCVYRL